MSSFTEEQQKEIQFLLDLRKAVGTFNDDQLKFIQALICSKPTEASKTRALLKDLGVWGVILALLACVVVFFSTRSTVEYTQKRATQTLGKVYQNDDEANKTLDMIKVTKAKAEEARAKIEAQSSEPDKLAEEMKKIKGNLKSVETKDLNTLLKSVAEYPEVSKFIQSVEDSRPPIGAIVAWHKNIGVEGQIALPDGWIECTQNRSGSLKIECPGSLLDGQLVPDLNTASGYEGGGRFLRGGERSGDLQGSSAISDFGWDGNEGVGSE